MVSRGSRCRALIQEGGRQGGGLFRAGSGDRGRDQAFVVQPLAGPPPALAYAVVNSVAVLIDRLVPGGALGLATPMSITVGYVRIGGRRADQER